MSNTYLKEIFTSIQGEALYIGERQIFIRFCGCNLHCDYCDTDFINEETFFVHDANKSFKNPVYPDDLKSIIENLSCKTVSLTGGEPLLYVDFLSEFLSLIPDKKIYLETNGTLFKELEQIIKYVDVVSMDIKLSCSTKQKNQFENNKKFIEVAKKYNKEIFAKVVLDKNYIKDELLTAINIAKDFSIPLIIQPMDCKDKTNLLNKETLINLMKFAAENYNNIRLIPQMHKYLDLL